jgi:ActR/RegA family two-component response regulator
MRAGKGRGHTTVVDDDGTNFREIASTMTELGFEMNHSSAHNCIVRVMRKFARRFIEACDLNVDDDDATIDEIAKSPTFQMGIADLLHIIEARRRTCEV